MATIALAETEKYEVLERIGQNLHLRLGISCPIHAHLLLGAGSFGIIRKVKRKSDGYVG